ncbi:MAG: phenylacetate-CoA oxygenase subunit PaaJ [Alphaproteobacteria bacterium]|nr:phenylacetate-CoA oxygenase subunit PaaJ [Alphaproteobacteria bacterium]
MSEPCDTLTPNTEQVWDWLSVLTDPEIPVVTLKEMGILRAIQIQPDRVVVTITPTYSGCPAMSQIEDDIRTTLAAHGHRAEIITRLAPAWSTDWMDAVTHRKLREYGIAPPTGLAPISTHATVRVTHWQAQASVPCPLCGSDQTTETSYFGSTACKALYKCLSCLEPFDYFKPH